MGEAIGLAHSSRMGAYFLAMRGDGVGPEGRKGRMEVESLSHNSHFEV